MLFRKHFKIQKDTVKFLIVVLLVFAIVVHLHIHSDKKLQRQFSLQQNLRRNVTVKVHSQVLASAISSSQNVSESGNLVMFQKEPPMPQNPESSLPQSPNRGRSSTVEDITQNNKSSSPHFQLLTQRKILNRNDDSVQESPQIVPKRKSRNYKILYHNGNRPHSCTIPSTRRMMMPIEDLFCLKMPKVHLNFKNPCWYAMSPDSQQPKLRCLPYFHIFGVCKSGTSDLFLRLLHHPQIVPNGGILHKETWYWTWKRYGIAGPEHKPTQIVSFNDYLDLFDATTIESHKVSLDGSETHFPLVTGHGDPMDFWDHTMWRHIPQNDILADEPDVLAPDLIRHINRNVKLILILRDPIERLYSHYLHGNYGTTAGTFHINVIQSIQSMKSCASQHSVRACVYNETFIQELKVPLSASMYAVHLKEWLRVFPRQQIFILRFENYIQDMARSLSNLFHFLQLDDIPAEEMQRIVSMPKFYETRKKDFAGVIYRETKQILHQFFDPYTRDLATLLNDMQYTWDDLQLENHTYNVIPL